MQTVGPYTLREALGRCEVGGVWSAVDAAGRQFTVAILDAGASEEGWRDAFAATAYALSQTQEDGLPIVRADYAAATPWVACAAEQGPGAAQIFLALGLNYGPVAGAATRGGPGDEFTMPLATQNPAPNPTVSDQHTQLIAQVPFPAPSEPGPAVPPEPLSAQPVSGQSFPTQPVSAQPLPAQPMSAPPEQPTQPVSSAPWPTQPLPFHPVSSPPGPVSSPPGPNPFQPVSSPPGPNPFQPVPSPPGPNPFQPVSSPPEVGPHGFGGAGTPVSGTPNVPVSGVPDVPVSGMPSPGPFQPVSAAPAYQYGMGPLFPPTEPPRRRTGLWIAVVAVVALALGAGGVAAFNAIRPGDQPVTPQSSAPVDLGLPTSPPTKPGIEPPREGVGWPSDWPRFVQSTPTKFMDKLPGLGFSFRIPPDWDCVQVATGSGYVRYACGIKQGNVLQVGGDVLVRHCEQPCDENRRTELRGKEEAWGQRWNRSNQFFTWAETDQIDGTARYGLIFISYFRSAPDQAIDRQVVVRLSGPADQKDNVRRVANSIQQRVTTSN